jgi:hypothetical protein
MILWKASPTPMKPENCRAGSASERPPTDHFQAEFSIVAATLDCGCRFLEDIEDI